MILILYTTSNKRLGRRLPINTGKRDNSYWTLESYFPHKLFQEKDFIKFY